MVLESLYHNEIELDLENVASLIASASMLSLVMLFFYNISLSSFFIISVMFFFFFVFYVLFCLFSQFICFLCALKDSLKVYITGTLNF